MSWMNNDGLFVKFGTEEGEVASGGHQSVDGPVHCIEVNIPYTELLSATAAIVGSVASPGARGVVIPKGAILERAEVVTTTAATSSGTVGSATLVMGTVKASDRSTALDVDGITTTSATMTALGI